MSWQGFLCVLVLFGVSLTYCVGRFMSLIKFRIISAIISLFFVFFFCLFAISGAAPAAYGGSQARG